MTIKNKFFKKFYFFLLFSDVFYFILFFYFLFCWVNFLFIEFLRIYGFLSMNVCILVFLTKLEVSAEPSVGGGVVESENWKKTNHLNATLPVSILKWETNFPMCALDSYAFCWEVSYTIAPQPADCVERANCVQVEEGWASMFWWTQGRIAQVKDWAPEFIYFCSVCCCCCCVGVLAVLGQLIGRTGCWFAFFWNSLDLFSAGSSGRTHTWVCSIFWNLSTNMSFSWSL